KSPQGMFGSVIKTYCAEKAAVDPSKIRVISLMPCTAKKHEIAIENLQDAGFGPDTDYVLTVRELDRLIKSSFIDCTTLEEEELDSPLDIGSGAGVIFGATGGVMEAALRTAYKLVVGENPDPEAFVEVRGLDGWKEAQFDVNGLPVRVAVASGLA
ncbi:MAG TPA: hydrogenase, partial [Coriobacteriia bacterium]|nr:hydrogenase [Coriobacteriia bacterium]